MSPKEAEAPVQAQPAMSLQQNGRMPVVNTQPSHEVDAVQNVSVAPKAEPSVTLAAAPTVPTAEPVQSVVQPKTAATVETSPKEAEAPVQAQPAMSLQQNGRMPVVNTQPSHEVDAVQNVSVAPKAEPSVTLAAAPTVPTAEPVQSVVQPKTAATVETSPKVAEAPVQAQPAMSLQQNGRMPVVNTPPSHEVDAVQNVSAAPKAEPSVTLAATPKVPTAEPVQSVVQPKTAATVEMSPKVAEAPVQAQLAMSLQQNGRMPVVNTLPSHEVDAVQNVSAAPKAEPSVTLAATPSNTDEPVKSAAQQMVPQLAAEQDVSPVPERQSLQQAVPAIARTLEEIVFSQSRQITVSRSNSLESDRLPQSAPVLRQQIITLDIKQPQKNSDEVRATSALQEGTTSLRHQDVGRKPIAAMSVNPETGLTPNKQPEIVLAGTAAEALVMRPEAGTMAKGTADIHTISMQQATRGVPVQLVPETHNENVRFNSTTPVTKETLVALQDMTAVGETALNSDDYTNSGQDQTWSEQPPDSQMVTQQFHVQSKSEQLNIGPVSTSKINVEQPRQELPEQVAHQVKERLTQHEVKPGNQQITLTLSPENLGELKMNLNLQGQRLSVEIVTENRTVRDAIMQHSDSLKETLARQNITVESFDVSTGGKGSGNQGQNPNAWRELAKQQQQQNWVTPSAYNVARAVVLSGPKTYQNQQGSTLDIHY